MADRINLKATFEASSPDDALFKASGVLTYENLRYADFVQMQLFGAKALVGMTEQLGVAAAEKKAGKQATSPTG